MFRFFLLQFMTVLLSFCPSVVTSASIWSETRGWQILVDTNTDDGCFMERLFDKGIKVRFGLRPLENGYYLEVLSQEWSDIVAGQQMNVDVDFGSDLFEGTALEITEGDWAGSRIFTNNPEVEDLFARKSTLSVGETGGEMVEIPLDGTKQALSELNDCQDAQPEPASSD
ncbi:hypothetical protein [Ruegeria sp. SCP11]|uniref:hypothetical protein n=1 Tax=Ruegeria sp. SCP11 TaxID=3141378 RepID=UPI003338D2FF